MGVLAVPESIDEAIDTFVTHRDALERAYELSIPRALETEVRAGVARILRRHG
jgi:hypothetical protein